MRPVPTKPTWVIAALCSSSSALRRGSSPCKRSSPVVHGFQGSVGGGEHRSLGCRRGGGEARRMPDVLLQQRPGDRRQTVEGAAEHGDAVERLAGGRTTIHHFDELGAGDTE